MGCAGRAAGLAGARIVVGAGDAAVRAAARPARQGRRLGADAGADGRGDAGPRAHRADRRGGGPGVGRRAPRDCGGTARSASPRCRVQPGHDPALERPRGRGRSAGPRHVRRGRHVRSRHLRRDGDGGLPADRQHASAAEQVPVAAARHAHRFEHVRGSRVAPGPTAAPGAPPCSGSCRRRLAATGRWRADRRSASISTSRR